MVWQGCFEGDALLLESYWAVGALPDSISLNIFHLVSFVRLIVLSEFHCLLANGFLPNRATWMLDFVALAMVGVLLALSFSIFQVHSRNNPKAHRTIQLGTAMVLLVALVAFEVDMQYLTDWRELAKPSPFYESGVVSIVLWIHLAFAIPTPFVWGGVIGFAVLRFRGGFQAGDFNKSHRTWGWIASLFMAMTSLTGWVFYWLAFVA